MDEKTVRALNAINRCFYRDRAAEFSATRQEAWPGWQRIAPLLREIPVGRDVHVLDVGCGNGRFAEFLALALPERHATTHYLGIDASAPLLAAVRARKLPLAEVATRQADLVGAGVAELLARRRFSLIAVFGVLHHIPGHRNRRALLEDLAQHLEPGGLMALAFWRFGESPRLRGKLRSWAEWNVSAEEPIDESRLEAGDQLLAWGPGGQSVRYCHFADAGEIRRLVEATSLRTLATYTDDGRERDLNRYFVLQMRGGN
jgi:SAM-dependent methyltransferase